MENNKESYKENSKNTFNNQAEIYDRTYYGKHASVLYDIVMASIENFNPKSLLDVGCGTGNILSLISKIKNIELYGVDLSKEMLKEAKKKVGNKAELKLGDSEHLPWKDESFESVICTDSFHHYPHPENVLREMARVLTCNGKIIIGDPWAPIILRQLLNIGCKFSKNGDYRIYSKDEIENLLVKCGFKNVIWRKVNLRSFIVTAEVNN